MVKEQSSTSTGELQCVPCPPKCPGEEDEAKASLGYRMILAYLMSSSL